MLLDLTEAFDTVDHNLMTCYFDDARIHGTTLTCLISFLQGQGQRVALGGMTALRTPLVYSLPQGVVLSPITLYMGLTYLMVHLS